MGQECQASEFYHSTSLIPALTQLCRYENPKKCLSLILVDSRRGKENVANDCIIFFGGVGIKISRSSVFPSIIASEKPAQYSFVNLNIESRKDWYISLKSQTTFPFMEETAKFLNSVSSVTSAMIFKRLLTNRKQYRIIPHGLLNHHVCVKCALILFFRDGNLAYCLFLKLHCPTREPLVTGL